MLSLIAARAKSVGVIAAEADGAIFADFKSTNCTGNWRNRSLALKT